MHCAWRQKGRFRRYLLKLQTRWLKTFRREATATAQLQHPNIVTLHDFGVAPHPRFTGHAVPFMVLEMLLGQSLDTLLRHGPLPPAAGRAVGVIALAEPRPLDDRRGDHEGLSS